MDKYYRTEQEFFWAGKFGDEYIQRNTSILFERSNTAFFSTILGRTRGVKSVLEFGCNIGLNLKSIHYLLPLAKISGIEINAKAAHMAREQDFIEKIYHQSVLDFETYMKTWDFVFTKGLLIHINPDDLEIVYRNLFESSRRYILICEYFNPTPITIEYRGNARKLFKRDFAGEMQEIFPQLNLCDYGFIWKNDPNFPQDNITWFLFEKPILNR
jgi:pseudaminic acid biosynthesis-associated methylase